MNAIQRRQYEMLLRVRDFGNTHRHRFSESGVGAQTLAAISTAVDELTATHTMKMSASMSARADRKAAARTALNDLLVKVTHLVRVLRGRGRTTPPFELPKSKSDQVLLAVARQFAQNAAPLATDFVAHGMPVATIANTAAAFETAMRDRGMSRARYTAAHTRIRELLSAALVEVRGLDVLVENELATDPVIQAVWKQTRRVEDPRRARGGFADDRSRPATEPDTAARIMDAVSDATAPTAAAGV